MCFAMRVCVSPSCDSSTDACANRSVIASIPCSVDDFDGDEVESPYLIGVCSFNSWEKVALVGVTVGVISECGMMKEYICVCMYVYV